MYSGHVAKLKIKLLKSKKTKQYYKAKADVEDSVEDFVYKKPKKININLEDRNKLIENNNIKLFSFEDERECDIEDED